MYAVFVDGSRQYRVKEGDVVKVDYREPKDGTQVEFKRVILLKADGQPAQIGLPTVEGARIVGEITEQTSEKSVIQYFRRRKNYRRLKGHTQPFTMVKVKQIVGAG